MKKIWLLGILLVLCSLAIAEEKAEIGLIDAETGLKINEVVAHIDVVDEANKQGVKGMFFRDDGVLELALGDYTGEIVLDDSSTDSVDYYFNGEFQVGVDENINFISVAKVNGNAYDGLNNLISRADLKFECDKVNNIVFPEKTGKYGDFVTYVPTGKCVVSASSGNLIGKTIINVEKGESIEVKIIVGEELNSGLGLYWMLLFIVVLLVVMWFLRKVPKKKPKKKEKKNRKLKSVLKTLNDKEKGIVEFLLSHKNVTSSKIRYGLKIPKTSLTRILDKLEEKKIIEVEKEGNLKKVRISEWLLK